MKYYLVTCQKGHCGRGRSTEITFAIKAKSILDATIVARKMPAVKHNSTQAVLRSKEITIEEYVLYRQVSAYERMG